jgi:hypothetical protein
MPKMVQSPQVLFTDSLADKVAQQEKADQDGKRPEPCIDAPGSGNVDH